MCIHVHVNVFTSLSTLHVTGSPYSCAVLQYTCLCTCTCDWYCMYILTLEAMFASYARELGRLVYKYGGEPVASFLPASSNAVLKHTTTNALFMDATHDNDPGHILVSSPWLGGCGYIGGRVWLLLVCHFHSDVLLPFHCLLHNRPCIWCYYVLCCVTLLQSRCVYDALPNTALMAIASCASGGCRGYDELVPHMVRQPLCSLTLLYSIY